MRRQLFSAAVGVIALTGSAFAADLAPPPPAYVLLLPIHGQASMPASRSVTPGAEIPPIRLSSLLRSPRSATWMGLLSYRVSQGFSSTT